jgi:hypothetical protein
MNLAYAGFSTWYRPSREGFPEEVAMALAPLVTAVGTVFSLLEEKPIGPRTVRHRYVEVKGHYR